MGGSWTEEKGWGYTVKFNDGNNTEIVVNFDKTSGRHYFYYYMSPEIGGEKAAETLVKFEAKDSAYRKSLNANYVVNEERKCTYMFRGGAEGGSGNLSSAYVYLMPNGGVVSLSGTSNSLTYNGKGNWTEDKQNHVISGKIGTTDFTTNAYCDVAGREGYRMKYTVSGGFGGSSTMTLYASCDTSKYTWDRYVSSDFEGEVVETWNGAEGASADYILELTAKGYVNIKEGSKTVFSSTYTKEGDTIIIDGEEFVDSIHITWTVKGGNPFTPDKTYDLTFEKPEA